MDRRCSQSPVRDADRGTTHEGGFGLAETLMAVAVLAIVLVMAIPGILLSQSVVLRSDGTEDLRTAALGAVESLRMVPFESLATPPAASCSSGAAANVLCASRTVTANGSDVLLQTTITEVASSVTGYEIDGPNLKRVEVTATLVSNPSRVWAVSTLVSVDGQVTIVSSPDGGGNGDGGGDSGSPATVPDAPTNVTANPGNAAATVLWTAPASNGGADITSYQATASDGIGGFKYCVSSGPSPQTTCTITELRNGTSYTVTVVATNSEGNSNPSSGSSPVVPATVPDAPTSVAGLAGDASVVVSWAAPSSDGGRSISAYTVTASPGGATCSPDPLNTTCTVTGLTNGVEYTFTVTATNAIGQGEPSAASAGVTPQSPQTSIELRVNVTKLADPSVPAGEWPTIVVYDADGTAIAASGTDGNDYLFDITASGTYQIAADVDGQVMPALFDDWQVDGEIYHAASQTQRREVTIDVSGGDVVENVYVFKPVILVLRATQMGQPTFLNPLTATISLGGQQLHQDNIVQGQSDPCNNTPVRLFAWAPWFHCMYRRTGGFYFQPGTYSITFSSPGFHNKTVGGVAPRAANACTSEWNAAYGSGACRYTTYAAGLDVYAEAPTWVRVVDDTGWGVGGSDVCVTITSGETCYVTDAAGYAEVTVDSSTGSGNATTFEISSSGSGYGSATTITQHVNAATYNDSAAAPLDLVLDRGNMKVHHLISRRELDHIDVRIKSGDSGAHSWYSTDLAPYEVVNGSSITLGARVAGTSIDAAEWSDCSSGTDWCWRVAVASYQPDLRVGFYSYCGSHDLPLEDGHDLNELGTQLRYRWHRWNALSATEEKQVDTRAGCG